MWGILFWKSLQIPWSKIIHKHTTGINGRISLHKHRLTSKSELLTFEKCACYKNILTTQWNNKKLRSFQKPYASVKFHELHQATIFLRDIDIFSKETWGKPDNLSIIFCFHYLYPRDRLSLFALQHERFFAREKIWILEKSEPTRGLPGVWH